jgi:hypothetical protein
MKQITLTALSNEKIFRLSEHWDRGFISYSRHGYLCAFILCLGSGLTTG